MNPMASETLNRHSSSSAASRAGTTGESARAGTPDRIEYRLNLPLILRTVVVLVVVAPAIYFWYNYRHDIHSVALLDRARKVRGEEKWVESRELFSKYLNQRPNDAEALAEFAEVFDKTAIFDDQKKLAILQYISAIDANPERFDLRLRRADLLVQIKRFTEALKEVSDLRELLKKSSTDAANSRTSLGADRLYARTTKENTTFGQSLEPVIELYEELLGAHPGDYELSVGLADLLSKKAELQTGNQGQVFLERADELIAGMLTAADREAIRTKDGQELAQINEELKALDSHSPGRSEDYKALDETRRSLIGRRDDIVQRRQKLLKQIQHRDLQTVRPDSQTESRETEIQDLLSAGPEEFDVVVVAAEFYLRNGETSKALDLAKTLLKIAPSVPRSYLELARISASSNLRPKAIQILRTGLERCGQENFELNHSLLDQYVQIPNLDAAVETRRRLETAFSKLVPQLQVREVGPLTEDLELFDAAILGLKGDRDAQLEKLRTLFVSVADLKTYRDTARETARRGRILASAYTNAGRHKESADTFVELIRLNPRELEYYYGAAYQLIEIDEFDQAFSRLRDAESIKLDVQRAWILLAENLYKKTVREPDSEKRNWTAFDRVIQQAPKQVRESAGFVFTQVAAALARSGSEDAKNKLKSLDNLKLEPTAIMQLAILWQTLGNSAQADAAIKRLEQSSATPAQDAAAKSSLFEKRKDTANAVACLEPTLEGAKSQVRNATLQRIIELEIDGGLIRSARNRLDELKKADAKDLWIYDRLADLAIVSRDFGELQSCERNLQDIEGADGILLGYCRAVRLLETKSDNPKKARDDVREIVRDIEAVAGRIPVVEILEGMIAEHSATEESDKDQRSALLDKAIVNYEKALRTGIRSLVPLQHVVKLLLQRKRAGEASAYIQVRNQVTWLVAELTPQVVQDLVQSGRVAEATQVARAGAELRPNDALSQYLLAQCLGRTIGQSKEAESLFRKATRLSPANARVWLDLMALYARQQQLDESRQAYDEMLKHLKLPAVEQEFVQAKGLEILGDREGAERHYQRAIDEKNPDPKILDEIAKFYLPVDAEKAFDYWVRALKIDPALIEPRRHIGMICGTIGPIEPNLARVIEMLGTGPVAASGDEARFRAALLLAQGGEDRGREAEQSLTELIANSKQPLLADRLLLARAKEQLGDVDAAQAQFEEVLKAQDQPVFQKQFVRFLNRNDRLELAETYLTKLERSEPVESEALLNMRIDWLKRSQRIPEIESLVEKYIERRLKDSTNEGVAGSLSKSSADLFTDLGLYEAAEKKYQDMLQRNPSTFKLYAVWLAERGRFAEAEELALKNAESDKLEAAATLLAILQRATRNDPGSSFDPAPAENFIKDIVDDPEISPIFLVDTAILRLTQGRFEEAVKIYERVIKSERENPLLLNNLAIVMVELPDRKKEALELIEKAVAALPKSVDVLDSKGTILLNLGRVNEAREIFQRICGSNPKNAGFQLHLARALEEAGDSPGALEHARLAIDNHVEKHFLTPAERKYVRDMKAKLSVSNVQ
jgi:tetratricopeptide (TPR) repeat protein